MKMHDCRIFDYTLYCSLYNLLECILLLCKWVIIKPNLKKNRTFVDLLLFLMNRNLKSWGHLETLLVSEVIPPVEKDTLCWEKKKLALFSDFSFCFSLVTFQEIPWNNFNLISTSLRQKDHCSQSRTSLEISWASLKGREGQLWLLPLPAERGAAEATHEVSWMTSGDLSRLGCSLPERISPRCDLRQNSETKPFVCNTCFPFLLPIPYSGSLLFE